jgi:hypothetical protein
VIARYYAPFRKGCGVHPASCTVGGINHLSPSSAKVKTRVELNLSTTVCAFMVSSREQFTFSLIGAINRLNKLAKNEYYYLITRTQKATVDLAVVKNLSFGALLILG